MRGFKLGFGFGFTGGGGAAGWIGYLLNALGFATSGEQTLTAPDPNLALDWEGTLTDFGSATNSDSVAVSAIPGSRLAAGVVYDDDGSGNPLHPSVTTGGVTDYVFYPARDNNESVVSEDYRTSGSGVGEYYYQQQEMVELVTNGGFATDTGWTKESGWSISGGAAVATSTVGFLYQDASILEGASYAVTFEITEYTSGSVRVFLNGGSGTGGTVRSDVGTYTEILTGPISANGNFSLDGVTTFTGKIDNVSIALAPSTSLTSPLENADGQWYEERVKNGSASVDAEFVKGTGWSHGTDSFDSDGTQTSDSDLDQTIPLSASTTYEVTFTATRSAGTITPVLGGTTGTARSTADTFTETITTGGTPTDLLLRADSDFVGTVTDISVIEVNSDGIPTNVLDNGVRISTTNHLLNSDAPATQTTGTLTVGWYSLLTWNNTGSCAVTAGTATIANLTGAASDGTPAHFEVTVEGTVTVTETGTVDYFQLQGGIVTAEQTMFILTAASTVTQTENVDESVLWTYEGRYGVSGQRIETSATQYLLNSETPATQTTGSIAVGDYVLWMEGTGSADLTAGTATISTTGSATDGTPLTFSVTVEGTVTVTVAGTEDRIQLEGGDFPTSIIQSVASTVTRSAVNLTVPTSDSNLGTADGAARLIITPLGTGQVGKILASYTDASNELSVDFTATTITLNKTVAGSTDTATKTYTHADGEQIVVDFAYGSGGMSINSFVIGATAGSAGTNAATSAAVLGTNIQFGASNDTGHINATFDTAIRSYATEAQASADIATWSL